MTWNYRIVKYHNGTGYGLVKYRLTYSHVQSSINT